MLISPPSSLILVLPLYNISLKPPLHFASSLSLSLSLSHFLSASVCLSLFTLLSSSHTLPPPTLSLYSELIKQHCNNSHELGLPVNLCLFYNMYGHSYCPSPLPPPPSLSLPLSPSLSLPHSLSLTLSPSLSLSLSASVCLSLFTLLPSSNTLLPPTHCPFLVKQHCNNSHEPCISVSLCLLCNM